jgi:CrcB protein
MLIIQPYTQEGAVMFLNCLYVGIGGFIGCVSRYLLSLVNWPSIGSLPFATLLVNIVGSFIIGIIVAFVARGFIETGSLTQLLLQVGFCGGFTTLSTFSAESMTLVNQGLYLQFIIYASLTFVLGVCACAAGMYFASVFTGSANGISL